MTRKPTAQAETGVSPDPEPVRYTEWYSGHLEPEILAEPPKAPPKGFIVLALGAVGVVYGDIGTSPLYALREALRYVGDDGLPRAEVLGVVSLLIWALVLIVTLKYVFFLLRVDNRGEGGVLALFALVQSALGRRSVAIFLLGIAGAALFFGDAAITPAISVLSAVEGLTLVSSQFQSFILPLTLAILIGLFLVQARGTAKVAAWFGPITLVWFLVMGASGAFAIAGDFSVLEALNPWFGLQFLGSHGLSAFLVLGAVFLAITGAEALYADLGHFGYRPIRAAWLWVAFPALALNYLGQAALVLANPETLENPFYLLVPSWGLIPLVILATMATIIASQAVITGAYSVTRQAVQLGLLPRFVIRHTSEQQSGQIYLPAMNWMLLGAVLALTIGFGTSGALASAYGIAVTGTMIVTTVLAMALARVKWHRPVWLIALVASPVVVVELAFLGSNLLKVADGGWVPLAMAIVLMVLMWAWWRGSALVKARDSAAAIPLEGFAARMEGSSAKQADGVAIFLTTDSAHVPHALLHNLKHNQVLHETNVVLSVEIADEPIVDENDRLTISQVSAHVLRLKLRFGFMETPNVSQALVAARKRGLKYEVMKTTFFLGRRRFAAVRHAGVRRVLDRLYILLHRVAADPTEFYHLPRDRVVEIGARSSV
jgi:KUP system potassium uptake protein